MNLGMALYVASDEGLHETTLCAACEEEPAVADERYCRFCCLVRQALDERYERRVQVFEGQAREDAGVLTVAEAIEPIRTISHDAGLLWVVVRGLALCLLSFAAFLVLGWYGIRFICWAGIQLADWVAR